ncbi:MAG: FkbM family methyltransferase [Gammaproteobacteria bacterium]|nr:FkbM family methyltransferase [Gammaproteobacteria bacterium]
MRPDETRPTPPSLPKALESALKHLQAGRLTQADELCRKFLLRKPEDHDALWLREQIIRTLCGRTNEAVGAFQSAINAATVGALRGIRDEWLAFLKPQTADSLASLWRTPILDAHRALMKSGLRDHPRSPGEDAVSRRWKAELAAQGPVRVKPVDILSAMLLYRSHALPVPENLPALPEWLREPYVDFLLEKPAVFHREGEADEYTGYLTRLIETFHKIGITRLGIAEDPVARALTYLCASRTSYIQTYFNTRNLRPLFAMRGDIIAAPLIASGQKTLSALPPRAEPPARIRLGIFAEHLPAQTETYFTLSHFEHLDHARFHITLYVNKSYGEPFERQCSALADDFVVLPETNLSDKVDRIRADDLDILLISTNMAAVTNIAAMLGAYRLARIQVASVSTPVTTGARHMDVMLSAEWNEPEPDAADHYTEHLYLMPGSVNYYAFQYDRDPATLNITRASLGLRDEQIVFFSGLNYYKILPELSRAWARILAAVPDSVLILMPFNFNWDSHYQATPFFQRIHRQMSELSIDPNRLRIADPVPARADVHRIIALADLYLDGYPFAGACSMLDPIIVGVPAVTRRGPVGRSNHAASLSRMIGMPELMTGSEEEYIATAVSLANDPARRGRIRDHLLELKNAPTPPYFDLKTFSTRVGDALQGLYDRYEARYRELRGLDDAALDERLRTLADSVVGANFELNTLTDIGLVHALIEPYFRAHHKGRRLHLVDVGACYGEMAAPLLAAGWSADLFEPDPGARRTLEGNLGRFAPHWRLFASAVSNDAAATVTFHKARNHGLSGLGDSPFGPTDDLIEVPNVRLADFYSRHGITHVDLLKIDAEGYDFDVLESHDFSRIRPPLVMIEYGTHFARQTLAEVNEVLRRMSEAGYGAVVFNYTDDGNFEQGRWVYRLTDIFVNTALPEDRAGAFGNILFYRKEDREFPLTLYALLENCLPRAEAWRKR